MIKPIETRYKGYRFRSRLEARWAVYFDTLGLHWEYEPQGFETPFGGYLPDFKVDNIGWVEVKGDLLSTPLRDWQRMDAFAYELAVSERGACYIFDGTPDLRMYVQVLEYTRPCRTVSDAESVTVGYGDFAPPVAEHLRRLTVFDRDGWTYYAGKDRMWWDAYENFFPDFLRWDGGALETAVRASRAARFEHGETP